MESPRDPDGTSSAGGNALRRLLVRARRPFPGSPALAVLQISLGGLVALAVLAVIGINALQGVAERQALHLTAEFATAQTNLTVRPRLNAGVLRGDPAALARLDSAVQRNVLSGKVLRVKLWDETGKIVYSDDSRYIGKRFQLSADEQRALSTGRVSGELSDLSAPDNVFDRWRDVRQVVQVCTRVTVDGTPLLLQLLVRDDDLSAVARDAARAELPAFLAALVALQVLQLPLAVGLVRRVNQGQREREALHRHAVEARDHERTRIARDLHDGVVQQLAGVSYSLSSVGVGQSDVPPDVLGVVRSAASTTRESALELRTLIAELTPPTVYEVGLPRALEDLVESVDAGGAVRVDLQVQPGFTAAHPDVSALLFRAAQEGLRNVVAHSGACRASVRLQRSGRLVRVVVQDDGRGLPEPGENGSGHHFGLRMLTETARQLGGHMDVTSRTTGGTTFVFELPDR